MSRLSVKSLESFFVAIVRFFPLLAVGGLVIGTGAGCGPRTAIADMARGGEWRNVVLEEASVPLADELRILVWTDYLAPEILANFEEHYGVRIVADHFSTNEELYAKLMEPDAAYDLIMPSDYMVQELREEGLLQRLGRDKIPNFGRIDPRFFANSYDPELLYSMPLFYDCVGIALNVRHVAGLLLTKEAVVEAHNERLVIGRRAITNEMRIAMGSALILLGHSPNTREPEEIAHARDFLIQTIRNGGLQFYNDAMTEQLAEEEVIVAIAWSGAVGAAQRLNDDVRFVIPRGSVIAGFDCFAIPKNARSAPTARVFLNYLLVPEITAALTNYNNFANTSHSSRAFVDREIANGPGYMFPLLDSAVFLEDVGEARPLYEQAWAKVRATPQPDIVPEPLPVVGQLEDDSVPSE